MAVKKISNSNFVDDVLWNLLMDAPASIMILNGPNHKVEFMNTEAMRKFGSKSYHLKEFVEIVGAIPELPGTLKLLNAAFIQKRTFSTNEYAFTRDWGNDGTVYTRHFRGSIKPFLNSRRVATGVTLYLSEVSDQVSARSSLEKHAFEDVNLLKEAETKLQGAVNARDEFLAIAAHELKTPLTSISLQVHIAKASLHRPEKTLEALNGCGRQVKRLTDLIENLLDVSKIRHGKLLLNKIETPINDIIKRTADRVYAALREANCKLDLRIDSDAVGFWDASRLEQVFENLFSNVIKYAPTSLVSVRVARDAESVVILFEDDGCGIREEEQRKIFDRFERASHSKNIGGLGLGLYVVREIILAHGGTISLESHIGKGTRFKISLPLSTNNTAKS